MLFGSSTKKHSLGGSNSDDEKSITQVANSTSRNETSILEKNGASKDYRKRLSNADNVDKSRNGDRIHVETIDGDEVVSEREIRKVQKTAEKIVLRREQNRQRQAQDIQRRLQEIEVRKAEVQLTGGDLEQRLVNGVCIFLLSMNGIIVM